MASDDEDYGDSSSGNSCLFDRNGEVDSVDYAKPLGRNNMAFVSSELVCHDIGQDENIEAMQRNLMMAALRKEKRTTSVEIHVLARNGRARHFLALIGMLWNGKLTGRVQDRPFDPEFDQRLLDVLLHLTNVPRAILDPLKLLTTAVAINDALLLTTAIDLGADVNDVSLKVSPLHNAKARRQDELVEILKQHGAK